MIIAVVVPGVVVTVVILLLISVIAMLIYKYLNGTRSCCELWIVKDVVVNIHIPCIHFSGSKPSEQDMYESR